MAFLRVQYDHSRIVCRVGIAGTIQWFVLRRLFRIEMFQGFANLPEEEVVVTASSGPLLVELSIGWIQKWYRKKGFGMTLLPARNCLLLIFPSCLLQGQPGAE